MVWIDLLNAFRNSKEIPVLEDSIITVNGRYKDKDGYLVEMSSDSHTICMELTGNLDNYIVSVKVDRNNDMTSLIQIKNVGDFFFPVTGKESFTNRLNGIPCLSKYRQDEKKRAELNLIFDWVNKVCLEIIQKLK